MLGKVAICVFARGAMTIYRDLTRRSAGNPFASREPSSLSDSTGERDEFVTRRVPRSIYDVRPSPKCHKVEINDRLKASSFGKVPHAAVRDSTTSDRRFRARRRRKTRRALPSQDETMTCFRGRTRSNSIRGHPKTSCAVRKGSPRRRAAAEGGKACGRVR